MTGINRDNRHNKNTVYYKLSLIHNLYTPHHLPSYIVCVISIVVVSIVYLISDNNIYTHVYSVFDTLHIVVTLLSFWILYNYTICVCKFKEEY